MYSIQIRHHVDKIFDKLSKKNPKQISIIYSKLEGIVKNPNHYKNLRRPMQHLKRVHIDKSFVLLFSIDENTKTITLEDYDHHDNIYS